MLNGRFATCGPAPEKKSYGRHRRYALGTLDQPLNPAQSLIQPIQILLRIIPLHGITKKDTLILPHHGYLYFVLLKELALQLFRRLSFYWYAAHLPEEIILHRAEWGRTE